MHILVVDGDEIPAFRDVVRYGLIGLQLCSNLVKVGDFQFGSGPNLSLIRGQVFQQYFQQGRLT